MHAINYWNTIGCSKNFDDSIYLDKLAPFITKNALIVEYGCGYGRLLRILRNAHFENLIGFDFADSMIERGKKENPDLDLNLLAESTKIPLADHSVEAIFVSTVLCSMIEKEDEIKLIKEISRVLKGGGIFYLSDFLISDHPTSSEKYAKGMQQFGEWGVYRTSENLTVRHFTTRWIMELLENFDIQWFEQFDHKTMNGNPARTFHTIARARS